ncbi:MAG TPA: nuclear transport factor 2 family protein [Candidatus Cloacimonadota bacterium]|nr:nuclear transport factor 2 family protein [Candidatus Cloacimonadota bacterium]
MKYFLVVLLAISLFSCDLSSPSEVNKAQIEEIFEGIKTAFDFKDVDALMQYYHADFLHNTDDWGDEYAVWQIRMNEYDTFDFANIEIDTHNSFATVSLTMTLDNEQTSEPTDENGDLSYFYKTEDGWKVCGNNFSE